MQKSHVSLGSNRIKSISLGEIFLLSTMILVEFGRSKYITFVEQFPYLCPGTRGIIREDGRPHSPELGHARCLRTHLPNLQAFLGMEASDALKLNKFAFALLSSASNFFVSAPSLLK